MEANVIMNLNNIIYRIYDADDLFALKKNVLNDIRMLIPCSYASILVANPLPDGPILIDPCCVPEQFLTAEERYIEMEDMDHLLWTIHSDQPVVICESRTVSDEKRLASPIYRNCYRKYDIYDTLQLNIVHEKVFMGVLTLYHTVKEGTFSEEDTLCMELLSPHLGKMFYLKSDFGRGKKESSGNLESLREQYSLTKRETEILSMIFQNMPDDVIAEKIHISPHTLKKHVQNIYHKLGISARWELLQYKI